MDTIFALTKFWEAQKLKERQERGELMVHRINKILGYDDSEDVFMLAGRYYLADGWWCDIKDGGIKLFEARESELRDMEKWKAQRGHLPEGDGPSISARQKTTKLLTEHLEYFLNPHNDPRIYTAKEVTFDYATAHRIRVDYMRFLPKNNSTDGIEQGVFYCYEIKSSVEDFHSPNGHNFIGDYNYYVMPEEVFQQIKEEIQERYNGYVGVYVPDWFSLTCVKKAKKKERERSTAEMLLMMFRSSNRELLKERKILDADL